MTKEPKILEIHYLDHVSIEHDENGVGEIRKAEPLCCTAFGQLLRETDVFVTLLCSYDNEKKNFKERDLRAYGIVVLKCCIIERKELVSK